MINYTKGKWTASHPQDNHTAFISDNNFQQKILMSVQWGSDISEIEQRANAQLIAAAPDMYEVLKELLEWAELSYGDDTGIWADKYDPAIIKTKKALAKADK
ncbi:hypothetical protein LCGC14_2063730 [marine sediment metagenome]|uniref:Uncharacterized protein n=1 Tax=marine sediment metagenome TaxID=412755 RepID=A0A0F9HHD6_9ZZZZ